LKMSSIWSEGEWKSWVSRERRPNRYNCANLRVSNGAQEVDPQ
jgi:hypothetical protein